MKVTQIFELTEEEREHLTFTMKLFREMAGNEAIRDTIGDTHFCEKIADQIDWFISDFLGEHFYTIDVPEDWE